MRPPIDRSAFALDPGMVYLNHAAIGVLPVRAREAMATYLDAHVARGVVGVAAYEGRLPSYRARLGRFLGCPAEGVAVLRNTSEAANVLARGLRLGPGDEVLTNDNEFGSNMYPWLALRERGVVVRAIETAKERLTPDVLRREIRAATKVVAFSWVTFADGYRHDVAGLAEVARAHGALCAVDAIQGAGAAPFDLVAMGVDAVYGGAQKWLLAEPGVGYLCVRPELLDRLAVDAPGWRSVEDIWDFYAYGQPWAPDATRFEAGTPNLLGLTALDASLELLEAAGVDRIEAHVGALVVELRERLRAAGATIAGPEPAPGRASGIVTFALPGVDPLETGRRLAAAGVVTTNRASGVRVSPHGYATREDLDALLAAL